MLVGTSRVAGGPARSLHLQPFGREGGQSIVCRAAYSGRSPGSPFGCGLGRIGARGASSIHIRGRRSANTAGAVLAHRIRRTRRPSEPGASRNECRAVQLAIRGIGRCHEEDVG